MWPLWFNFRAGKLWVALSWATFFLLAGGSAISLVRGEEPAPKPITNSLGMQLVAIPAGQFLQGSDEPAADLAEAFSVNTGSFADEFPQHPVKITQPFYLGQTEVTLGQFKKFVLATKYRTDAERDGEGGLGFDQATGQFESRHKAYSWKDPGWEQTDDFPVVNVSWNDAQAFCQWLSKSEQQTYRLPTEAEWEYACRAGTKTRYNFGVDPNLVVKHGNTVDGTARKEYAEWLGIDAADGFVFSAPVAQFKPNAFGLYDMHGNVWEWCQDYYDASYYKKSPAVDPLNQTESDYRTLRGGSWSFHPRDCRSSVRGRLLPNDRSHSIGFRVARNAEKPAVPSK